MKRFLPATLLGFALTAGFSARVAQATYADLFVTEIMPDSSSSPDWFELFNKGTTTLSLANFKMDDSGASYPDAVPLMLDSGLTIGPGEILIFIETDTPLTAIPKFRTFWGGAAVNLRIGSYTGSGVGFSKDTPDGVTLFNQVGTIVTQVSYLSPAPNVSESFNAFNPQTDTRSALGVGGGYQSAGDSVTNPANIGSPGLIPEPGCTVLLAIGALSLARRPRRSQLVRG